MGTSQSSGGPGSGVSMVPPWTPDPPTGDASGNGAEGGDAPADDGAAPPQVPPPAPARSAALIPAIRPWAPASS